LGEHSPNLVTLHLDCLVNDNRGCVAGSPGCVEQAQVTHAGIDFTITHFGQIVTLKLWANFHQKTTVPFA
jgi:hypothetical protein